MNYKPNTFNAVGKNQPRLDGAVKVSGRSEFTDDIVLPGMLHCKFVRSPHARAKILNIDTSKAERLPGVKAIITNKDAEDMMFGPDQYVLCKDTVNFIGDEVAAIAAVDRDIAAEAAELIKVEYEPLPPVLTMAKALRADAPQIHQRGENNIAAEHSNSHGDPDKAFAESDHVRVDQFTTPVSHNCYAEFHAVVADYSRPEKLSMWTPGQSAILMQAELAKQFKLSEGDVRILNLNTGGAFSGRVPLKTHHLITALLSRKAARPVKFFAAGDEEFLISRAGGYTTYRFKSGATKEGKLKVIEVEFNFDSGAYIEGLFLILMLTGAYLHLLYTIEAVRYHGRLIYTNNMPYHFHHGGGLAQMQFGFGQHLDRLAEDLGMDPVDFQLLNAVETGHTTMTDTHYASCGLKECIEKAAAKSDWKNKYGKLPPFRGIGLGIGAMASGGGRGPTAKDTSAAFLKIAHDGTLSLFTGLPDMGQSSHTAMAIIASEVLGVKPTDITVIAGDTDVAPFDIGAFSQRGTFMTGNAVIAACNDALEQMSRTVAKELDVDPSELVYRDQKVFPAQEPQRSIPFKEAVLATMNGEEGRFIMGRGYFTSPRKSGAMAYSFGAQIIEVEVEPDTGIVKVLSVTAAHDVGRALNPRIVEGQMDGQIFSGMSQVLYEECLMDEGQILNPSRLEYKMPRSYEMPEVDHIIVESIDPYGPFGAKEVGEGPIVCTLQAVANAVANAIGQQVTDMPITPWRVLRTIKQKEARERRKNSETGAAA